MTLLFSTYAFFAFLSSFPWGVISDKWGRRPILCFSMLGTALSLLGSARPMHYGCFSPRALGGLMGGTLPVAQAYIADVTRPEDRAGRMGLMGLRSARASFWVWDRLVADPRRRGRDGFPYRLHDRRCGRGCRFLGGAGNAERA